MATSTHLSKRPISVVGAGVSGLTAALALHRAGLDVVVLEASARPGGQVLTERTMGFIVEHGADTFVPTPMVLELSRGLGLGEALVRPLVSRSLACDGTGALREVPEGEAAILLGLRARTNGLGVASFAGGTGMLIESIVAAIPSGSIRYGHRVLAIRSTSGAWLVEVGDREPLEARGLVLAIPWHHARRLVASLCPQPPADVPALSSVTVSCAFPRKDVEHPLDASGFVTMGPREAAGLKACTFSSSKFDGRAPEGWLLLRAFYRPGPHAGDSDRAWVERATEDLAPTLGLRSAPATAWVARWDRALEIYGPHHAQTLRASLPSDRVPPLGLAGAGVDGLGLSAAVESGLNAAATLQARLGAG